MQSNLWLGLKRNIRHAVIDGTWEGEVPGEIRRNLRWFFLDGMLGSVLDGVVPPFLSLYLLALGATSSQVGLMTSISGYFSTLMLVPGAITSERSGRRKLLFMLCGAGIARSSILMFALLPFVLPHSSAIYAFFVIKVLADGLGNFSGPAWTSLAGDIVPMAWRGRYFGSRTFFMTITSMIATFLAGSLISHFTSIAGYQLAFGLAFFAGVASTICFGQIKEPSLSPAKPGSEAFTLRSLIQTLAEDQDFRNYIIFGVIWNLAFGIGGPYFTLYMVQGLNSSASLIAIYTVIGSVAALPALRLFGRLTDSWGNRKVMQLTGMSLMLLPLAWLPARVPLHGILINIPGGLLWAGFNLASFNFLLTLAPSEKVARYAALFQVATALASSSGTFLASVVLAHWGYAWVFILCCIGRCLGMAYLFISKLRT
jgi:MFS family permease